MCASIRSISSRHRSMTGQAAQIAFAAEYDAPREGKKTSTGTPAHAARSTQSAGSSCGDQLYAMLRARTVMSRPYALPHRPRVGPSAEIRLRPGDAVRAAAAVSARPDGRQPRRARRAPTGLRRALRGVLAGRLERRRSLLERPHIAATGAVRPHRETGVRCVPIALRDQSSGAAARA
jgi:hypothetical protein